MHTPKKGSKKSSSVRMTGYDEKGKRNAISTMTDSGTNKSYTAGKISKPTYSVKNDVNASGGDDFKKSMDTTGYAGGKQQFTVNSVTKTPKGTISKSAKIGRDQVNPTLDKWKAAASKMKKGGSIKTKSLTKAQKGGKVEEAKLTSHKHFSGAGKGSVGSAAAGAATAKGVAFGAYKAKDMVKPILKDKYKTSK